MIKIRHRNSYKRQKNLYIFGIKYLSLINKDLNEKGKTLDKVLKHRNVK